MNEVRQKCIDVFARVFGVSGAVIADETSPDTLNEWDSLVHVQLIAELENVFSITISPDEAIEFETFKNVFDSVNNKVGN
jgi:acyl carrier protein